MQPLISISFIIILLYVNTCFAMNMALVADMALNLQHSLQTLYVLIA